MDALNYHLDQDHPNSLFP